jgi:hypothetical protein
MNPNDGGAAFPRPVGHNGLNYEQSGMSLRDYFAGQSLAMINYHNILLTALNEMDSALAIQNAAVLSYRLADAMLAQRNK